MLIVVAYCSFTNELFIHCRNLHKSNALNNKYPDGIHPVVVINRSKSLFTVRETIYCIQQLSKMLHVSFYMFICRQNLIHLTEMKKGIYV